MENKMIILINAKCHWIISVGHKMLWENPNELSGQPDTQVLYHKFTCDFQLIKESHLFLLENLQNVVSPKFIQSLISQKNRFIFFYVFPLICSFLTYLKNIYQTSPLSLVSFYGLFKGDLKEYTFSVFNHLPVFLERQEACTVQAIYKII